MKRDTNARQVLVVELLGERGVADEVDEPDGGFDGAGRVRLVTGQAPPHRWRAAAAGTRGR